MGTVIYRAAHDVGKSIVGVRVQGGTLSSSPCELNETPS
jgi:hypothetical protein